MRMSAEDALEASWNCSDERRTRPAATSSTRDGGLATDNRVTTERVVIATKRHSAVSEIRIPSSFHNSIDEKKKGERERIAYADSPLRISRRQRDGGGLRRFHL